ncbi:MAG TPA: DUF5781 family protein [Candidatus Bathyarchaeia archaeon]|nr:DUF5781 family protein [Candidatus Bathyarchaeia archaeon]
MKARSNIQAPNTETRDSVEDVNRSFKSAVEVMAKSGYKIPDNVTVSVDPNLPFMGYTMPTRRGFNIVVAGGAVGSSMLEGLLVHEMSHIYRIHTNHPSHNAEILGEAVDHLAKRTVLREYQQKIIHDLLNDIQDLYADDIAFKVIRKIPMIQSDQITEFLQSWVKENLVKSPDTAYDNWNNASTLAHNARAIAQMKRHGVEDIEGRAAQANKRFLAQVSPAIAKHFDYFRNALENLQENMTAAQYRQLLVEYLDQFLNIAEDK